LHFNHKMHADKQRILVELKALLKENLKKDLKEVILFGSQVSEMAYEDSDYDILILLRKKIDWRKEREISDLCYEIDLKYGIITDTIIVSEKELSSLRGKQPIIVNAIEKGLRA